VTAVEAQASLVGLAVQDVLIGAPHHALRLRVPDLEAAAILLATALAVPVVPPVEYAAEAFDPKRRDAIVPALALEVLDVFEPSGAPEKSLSWKTVTST
jgi:hypothetical protein